MKRIPASTKLRKEVQEILEGFQGESLMSEFFKKASALLLQELLEQEATDFLGRNHYERKSPDDTKTGYRNGYEPRNLRTAEGKTTVFLPQVRGSDVPFHTKLGAFFQRKQ